MFKNMKIEITDEAHLKAVCERLDAMGYKYDNARLDSPSKVFTYDCGTYMLAKHARGFGQQVTLGDLLKMRDITDNVSDIRNHVSPHTVVIDL